MYPSLSGVIKPAATAVLSAVGSRSQTTVKSLVCWVSRSLDLHQQPQEPLGLALAPMTCAGSASMSGHASQARSGPAELGAAGPCHQTQTDGFDPGSLRRAEEVRNAGRFGSWYSPAWRSSSRWGQ
jgi:hypothetical protein